MIEVKFDKFDLESDTYCRFDYVVFFNGGEKDDSSRIGKYCGDTAPQSVIISLTAILLWISYIWSYTKMFYSCIHPCFLCPICRNIITNSNVLLVQFVSDLSVTSDGFMASYTSIPRGLRTPTAGGDVASGPRVSSTATRPRLTPVKPVKPVVFTTEATTTTTTEQPKPRPKPVRPIKPVRRPVSNPEPDESRPGEEEIRETNDAGYGWL